ncbi:MULTISPECIES: acetolactate synthase small subunit [Vibrio]|uniref:Acetolactate synthase small subunit n=2 Tax=Vibrio genomosp. F10 TaxID=723171 RepID=A0A1B9QX89_9VIBR|nr:MULTISPECIES: acetolactate synthase small subunit [Vibrio]OCH74636.1 acetolactate synthase small subunit [Vibrio genomosp. F10]OEE34290.1 acetolactate synthase small subunit [Vibrio genomosp. F10 str. ZF-129]OEE95741.1 acetolactate synthase small subunit [Vibrio genomosp. F10 str. 9ZC157]OEF01342.1 acetolactate synthase small subunit [Vibrio genomosp. F10 str. 9ZD137]OEF03782.1 acetolactate synthase small subunit [Vibrio genomosp. F10 str. 9ZB36]
MRHILSILMENQAGALSRVVGLFSQRGYNIESLTVSPTNDETLSRLNITTESTEMQLEQIQKQLHKLIDVLKVQEVTELEHIERELMMVKVKASGFARAEVKRTADIFRGQIVDVTASQYTVQLTGTSEKLDAFIKALSEVTDVIEVARSGVVGIARGERALRV